MNKRKLNEDKESEFHIGGNQVDIPKVKKAKYREAYSSSIARFGKFHPVLQHNLLWTK